MGHPPDQEQGGWDIPQTKTHDDLCRRARASASEASTWGTTQLHEETGAAGKKYPIIIQSSFESADVPTVMADAPSFR